MSISPTPLLDRLERNSVPEPNSGCVLWTGYVDKDGYGRIGVPKAFAGRRTNVPAHRLAYELAHGVVSPQLHLDHKCRVRCCINEAHLEPVTPRENLMRSPTLQAINAAKTHCKRGHPLSGDNLYLAPNGHRACRSCRYVAATKCQWRRRGTVTPRVEMPW